jgi:hypothetical protein
MGICSGFIFSFAKMTVREDIVLSNGTVIRHARLANGAQEAIADRDGGEMTPAEWDEYCEIIRGRAPGHVKT